MLIYCSIIQPKITHLIQHLNLCLGLMEEKKLHKLQACVCSTPAQDPTLLCPLSPSHLAHWPMSPPLGDCGHCLSHLHHNAQTHGSTRIGTLV